MRAYVDVIAKDHEAVLRACDESEVVDAHMTSELYALWGMEAGLAADQYVGPT